MEPLREHYPTEVATRTAQAMTEAAKWFLQSLSSEQSQKLLFSINSPERMNWDYRPRKRVGLMLKDLDGSQRKLAHALLASALSTGGYIKAIGIMALEKVLGEMEGPSQFSRDPDSYYITLFGYPSQNSIWGLRFEGHHVSVNFLVTDDGVAATPNFFGANPAHVPSGPMAGFRILAAEEDLARTLLLSLNPIQRARAIIETEAPADIVTRWDPRVRADNPAGISASEMKRDQHATLNRLITEYIRRMPDDVADYNLNQIERDGFQHIHFAWAGFDRPGQPHYYRLHGVGFLVEYDNVQNQANHIHTVWRDLRNDWGEDFLRNHYLRSHGA